MRTLARVSITYEVAEDGTERTPIVEGRLGGHTARLVLDTGSDVHLLTKELVDRLGLAVQAGEDGTDHGGAPVPSWAVEDAALGLGGAEVTLRDVVAITAPPPFSARRIDGILSPQHLHPSAWAVIDLLADELLLLEGTEAAVAAWLAERSPALTTLALVRDEAHPVIVVHAAIRPHPEVPTMLNTGGSTEFSSAAAPGLARGSAERLGGGVSGAGYIGERAGEATLVVGGHELPVPSLALRSTMPDPPGMVGIDVLRGTILTVCADAGRPVLWQVP